MENKITSKMVLEAMEQVRMGFTASRIALGAATLLYPLKKLNQKWGNKFTKIQNEYHQFLLDIYKGFEEELPKLEASEKEDKSEKEYKSYNIVDKDVADAVAGNPYGYKG